LDPRGIPFSRSPGGFAPVSLIRIVIMAGALAHLIRRPTLRQFRAEAHRTWNAATTAA